MFIQERCTHTNPDGTRVLVTPASPFSRVVARIIDMGVCWGNIIFFMVAASYVQHLVTTVLALLSIFVSLGYFLFADGLFNGQSAGKLVLEIQVVDANTLMPCTWRQSFVRNGGLLVPYANLMESIFLYAEETARRGDISAGTMVIRKGSIHVSEEPEEDLRPLKLEGLKNTLEQVKMAQERKK